MRKIVLFEINEIPYRVLDYYVEKFPQSNLAKIFSGCTQYETETPDTGHLSPWITWSTLHRGVNNEKHGIQDFGEDMTQVDAEYPQVWKLLMDNGVNCGVFASMHSYPPPKNYQDYAFFVPDPFAGGSEAHPKKIIPFQQFNLAMSRKSGRNVDTGIDMKSAVNLGISLPGLGIKVKTMAKVGNQLLQERIHDHLKTRRRTFQSVLAFDIFMKLLKSTKPDFCTCFSNHVASAMHRYWAAAFPNDYKQNNMDKEWLEKYGGEVDFAMNQLDSFIGDFVDFANANPEYQIWFVSSMGQKATQANMLRSETYCKNMPVFISTLGLSEGEWEQRAAMHPQYNLQVNANKMADFRNTLQHTQLAGRLISFREKENGFFSIDLGHKNLEEESLFIDGKEISFAEAGLTNEPIDDETGSTAYHVKEGVWFIFDPQKEDVNGARKYEVPSTAVVPQILKNFGVSVPDYMKASIELER